MMSNARRNRLAPRAALLLAAAAVLSGCGTIFSSLPEGVGGLPVGAPERPAETMPFPNVYEPRPKRQATPLNDDEQKKLESELTRLRDEQIQRANPPPPPPPPKKTAVPVKKDPVPAKKAAAKETAPAPAKKKQNDAVVPEQKGPVAPPKLIN